MNETKKFELNFKTWFYIITILIAAGTAAYFGANVTVNLTLEARLNELENQINVTVNSTVSALIKQASYIISVHDPYYCLWNGSDDRAGKLEYYSTNASALIKNAVNNASLVKGSVFIKAGDYPISPNIDANFNNTLIYGEGVGTRLYLPNSQPDVVANRIIFDVENCENVTIQNLMLDGNFLGNPTNTVFSANINIVDSNHVTVQYNYIANARHFGVHAEANSHNSTDIHIDNNWILEDKWNGIQFTSGNLASTFISGSSAKNNYIKGCNDIGINIFADPSAGRPSEITIAYNNIDCNDTSYLGYGSGGDAFFGIRIEAGYNNLVQGNTISNSTQGILDSIVQGGAGNNSYTDNTVLKDSKTVYSLAFVTDNNYIAHNTAHSIALYGDSNIVESNTITGASGPYIDNSLGGLYYVIRLNVLKDSAVIWNGVPETIMDNIGYNPVGVIATPVTSTYLRDDGTGAIVNNTMYTCSGSPKNIYVYGGTLVNCTVEGIVIFTTTPVPIHLEPSDAILFCWSSAPTIVVIGE